MFMRFPFSECAFLPSPLTLNSRLTLETEPIVNQEQDRPVSAFAAICAFLLIAGVAVAFVKIEPVEDEPALAGLDIRAVARSEASQ